MAEMVQATSGFKLLVATEARAAQLRDQGIGLAKQTSVGPHLDLDNLEAFDLHDIKGSMTLNDYAVKE